jgi:hypothetical protein
MLKVVSDVGGKTWPELGFWEATREARVRERDGDLGFPAVAGNSL